MPIFHPPEPRPTYRNSREKPSVTRSLRRDHSPSVDVTARQLRDRVGQGEPIPEPLRTELGAQVGWDLSGIRVHSDARGDYLARALSAEAVAFGHDIAVRTDRYQPQTLAGQALLRHEAQHVADTAGGPVVNLSTDVDDASEEMADITFALRTTQGGAPKGANVVVVDWRGTGPAAQVRFAGPKGSVTFEVSKLELEPPYTPVAGVRQYRVGLAGQQAAVAASEQTVQARASEVNKIKAQESSFKKRHDVWEKNLKNTEEELANQKRLLAGRQTSLSRMLVRQTMYNRFDADITRWVDHYDKLLKPKEKCDPNLVKSMLFQESRMGVEGQHLEPPPYDWSSAAKHPVRSRFNVMQAVDSSGEQQLLMLKEMAPDLYTGHKLDEFEKAHRASGLTEAIIWGHPDFVAAVREFFGRRVRGLNVMGSRDVDLHLDYSFWIRTGVRWLFYKYKAVGETSWAEAARAYNGVGKQAQTYRNEVISRVGGTGPLDVGNQ